MADIELPKQKKVGHLTLLRESRSITAKEFNLLSPEERMEIIRRAQGGQKYKLLFEARDPKAIVRKLPIQDVYMLIRERGLDESTELVELVSSRQLTAFFDLDCWEGDQIKADAALSWLAVILDTDNEQQVLRTALGLDLHLLVLILKKFVTVTQGLEAFEDDDAMQEAIFRDGGYELDFADSESAKIVGLFLDIIRRLQPEFYPRLMEAVRWESESVLEEETYQSRCRRLQDLGIPDAFESLGIYAYQAPETFAIQAEETKEIRVAEEGVVPPSFVMTAATPGALLAEILAAGLDDASCWEMTYLVNKVMSADRIDMGEPSQVKTAMERVFLYLNLALQHLASNDVEKAAHVMRENYLEDLFRLGFNLTLRLQRRARELRKSAIAPYLDGPFRALIEALGHAKPLFFEGVLRADRGGERPFADLHEVHLAGQWLERLEVQRALFETHFPFTLPAPQAMDLDGCTPELPEELALSDFFLTALANRLMGRPFLPTPLAADELPGLHAKVCENGQVRKGLQEETEQWLESLVPGGAAFGAYCLELWQEEFCALAPEDLDPRYVGGLILRLKG